MGRGMGLDVILVRDRDGVRSRVRDRDGVRAGSVGLYIRAGSR